jgi:hypothetical protein
MLLPTSDLLREITLTAPLSLLACIYGRHLDGAAPLSASVSTDGCNNRLERRCPWVALTWPRLKPIDLPMYASAASTVGGHHR